MCSHYLVDPVACTPSSGWEKGQVENQVGLVRERFFTPRVQVMSCDELNAWLLNQCVAYARANPVFEAERPSLVPYGGRFDGLHAILASVSNLPRPIRQQVGSADGDRQMVSILTMVLSDGLQVMEAACLEALREGVHSADIVLNIPARHREPAAPLTILTPDVLRLTTRRRRIAPDMTL